MTRTLPAAASVVLLAGSLVALACPTPAPAPRESPKVARLVALLGHDDFALREAAESELDALGSPALEQLRAACKSPNPEVARRADGLVGRIERRVANEVALAPTLVSLAADNATLDAVLDDLAEQSGYPVAIGGGFAAAFGSKKVTLKTGTVPFWTAVLAICDAADLRIASVSGYIAPGSGPPGERPNPFDRRPPGERAAPAKKLVARPDPNPATAIFMEPHGDRPKRPAAVYGAVLVEAFEIPPAAAAEDTASALLQVWPEPRLNWQATTGARVNRATDDAGQRLAVRPGVPAHAPQVVAGNNVVIVRNVQGGVVLVNPNAAVPPPPAAAFTPNPRQAVANLRPGPKPSATLTEFSGVVMGTFRSRAEQLAVGTFAADATDPQLRASASGRAGVELRASAQAIGTNDHLVRAEVNYDPARVDPSGANGHTPVLRGGFRAGQPDPRGRAPLRDAPTTVYGVQVTDAEGRAFALAPLFVQQHIERRTGRHWGVTLTLRLTPTEKGQTAPKTVSFLGTSVRPVEVPFALKGVPLAVGSPQVQPIK
jgi:hypothetical protein